jgi:hypothetical protein
MFGMPKHAHRAVFAFCAALLSATPGAYAKSAVGILTDVDGPLQPLLSPGTEIAHGQTLALTRQSTVSFVHYGKCEFVTVRGGSLVMNESDYRIEGGTVLAVETVSCPQARPALARSSEGAGTAAVVMRGLKSDGIQPIQSRPRIVLAGTAAADIVAVDLAENGRVIARLPVRRRQAAWGDGMPPLVPNARYMLRFVHSAGWSTSQPTVVSDNLKSDGRLPAVFVIDR